MRVLQNSGAQREEWKLRDEQIVVAHGFALAPIEDGRIEGCQVVLENVTLQRQEELQKLQEREYRLLQAQQMARLGGLAMGRRANLLLTSSLFCKSILQQAQRIFFRLIWNMCQRMNKRRFVVNGNKLLRRVSHLP